MRRRPIVSVRRGRPVAARAEPPELSGELIHAAADDLVRAPREIRDQDQIAIWLLAAVKLTARRMRAAYPDARAEQRRERVAAMLHVAVRALTEAWA